MTNKKTQELQEYSLEDLKNELVETELRYQRMRFDHASKGLDKPLVIREVRRDIARIHTEIRRRELDQLDESTLASRSRIRERRRKSK